MIIRTCICGETFILRTKVSPNIGSRIAGQFRLVHLWDEEVDRHFEVCKIMEIGKYPEIVEKMNLSKLIDSLLGTEDEGDYL